MEPSSRYIQLLEVLGRGLLSKYLLKAKAADGTLDYLFAKCLELSVQFEDESFPHDQTSLIQDWSSADKCVSFD